jgi:hypothetical protein
MPAAISLVVLGTGLCVLLLVWSPAQFVLLVPPGMIALALMGLGSYSLWRGTWVITLDRAAGIIALDRSRLFQNSHRAAEWHIQDVSDVLVVKSVNSGGRRKYHVYVRLVSGKRERVTHIARHTRGDYQDMINRMHHFLFHHAPARHRHRSSSL